ncbi:MAG: response regulator transcription factor [Chloroflexi bacterium]|nr:response regulator transcription factor [Chloroflexota bacterium]
MRTLVIEDDERLRRAMRRVLEREGGAVEEAPDGLTGLEAAVGREFDLVILDVLLPGLNGIKVCRAVRAAGVTTPILMLTALGAVEDRVTGLDAGADDYLGKPFSFDELLARMRALSRRPPLETPETVLTHEELSLDLVKHQMLKNGAPVALSATEFRLLEFFMRHPGQVISRARILEVVWGYSRDVESNVVDTYVHYLRSKIDGDDTSHIRTVRGAGYALGN